MNISVKIFIILLSLWLAAENIRSQAVSFPEVRVSPNILVSRDDADFPHAETMLAVNPKNPNNLIGAAIVFTNREYGVTSKLYVSFDGGNTWQTIAIPETARFGTVDPQIAFGADGTAYFLRQGRGQNAYRSTDGGLTWEKAGKPPVGVDHPQVVVDRTDGKFSGRFYVSVMNGIRQLIVSRSEDGGKSYPKTADVPNPRKVWKLNVNPLVLSDGTLFVPYVLWDDTDGKTTTQTEIEFVTSTDGGDTFSTAKKIGVMGFKPFKEPEDLRQYLARISHPHFAASPKDDFIYAVWSDDSSGEFRVYFTMSKDKGKTWSKPQFIDKNTPANSKQYQAHVAVNNRGAVGVMWYDTRNSLNQDGYDLYFAASVDEGKSFSPPKKVSSAISKPLAAKNILPFTGVGVATKDVGDQRFRSALARWGNGGDYLGFATDSDGDFRPFWIDSREEVFQVYTAEISVEKKETLPKNLKEKSVRDKIKLIFDPIKYDFAEQELTIPVRLQNISNETLYAPLKLQLDKPKGLKLSDGQNSQIIDFSTALGDFKNLPPNAVSEPIKLKFTFDGLANLPSFSFDAVGKTIVIFSSKP